ncbi:MAG TPA: META domain-containing protein [Aliiroseovarius sp.]|nr:META domain-containing protein [Aliiroseovarius sp.]
MKYSNNIVAVFFLPLALAACTPDESLTAFVPPGSTWTLIEMNGEPVRFDTTLTFPEPGRIEGQAVCNRYSAAQTAPYPWFDAEDFVATKMACDGLADEQAYFDTLASIAFSEVSGPSLALSGESGEELIFALQ